MNIKDKIAEIVSDKTLSHDEMIARINALLSGKNGGGAGITSDGTGKGSGGEDRNSSSSSSSSENGESGESGEGSENGNQGSQNGEGNGSGNDGKQSAQQLAQAAQQSADEAQAAADAAQKSADDASANGDPSASQKQAAADKAQEAADKAQAAADAAADAANEGDSETASQKASEAKQCASETKKQSNSAGAGSKDDAGNMGNGSGEGDEDSSSENGESGESGEGSENGNQGSQNSKNGSQSQNQGGQQNQGNQPQDQKQDPEEWLKDLDLGKKQRYQKAKGDGSDDPMVNGLPPGEVEDDGSDDQDGFGGQMPEEFDDYKAGYYIGKAYAKEMFKAYGAKPIYSKYYDIPDVDPMKIIESMITESSRDDEIRNILSGSGNASAKAEDIYRILFPDYKDDGNNDINDDVVVVDDATVDDWRDDNHVISRETGNDIKDKLKADPHSLNSDNELKDSDPDWGTKYTDGETQERMRYIKHILDPNKIPDKFTQEVARRMIEKFGARIEKNSEGIIDWKKVLKSFLNNFIPVRTQGPIRQSVYTFSGIGARHRKTTYKREMKKVVIYADTSGSAYSFCSTAISEVSKMARDCNIELFDINLFTDTVYSEHKNLRREDVSSDDFGFENVDSGGTDVNNVYNHIIEDYIDGYDLVNDVACVIIMTDVDGISDSSSKDITNNPYLKNIADKLVYLIFDPSNTPRRSLNKYFPKGSEFLLITPEMMNEGASCNNRNSVLEAIAGKTVDDVANRIRRQESDTDYSTGDDVRRKLKIQSMRRLGRMDELVPRVFEEMKSVMPNLKYTNDVNYFEDTEGTYYIDDDLRVWIHNDFSDNNDVLKLIELCGKIKIYRIIGNVTVKRILSIRGLPAGFPKVIEGKFTLANVPNLESLDNIPSRMEDYYINLHDSRRHHEKLLKQAAELGLDVNGHVSSSALVSQFKSKNESMKIDEAIGRRSVDDVKKQIDKAKTGQETEVDDEVRRKMKIQSMRRLDRMDELVPDIFDAMGKFLPEVSSTKDVSYFEDAENTFYIDDDLRLWIHKDFDTKEEVERLISLCSDVSVFMIIGRVCIVNDYTLKELPSGFPKEIKGYFKMQNLFNLRSFNNAPSVIYGNQTPAIEVKSRWIRPLEVDKYKKSLRDKQNNTIDVYDLLRKSTNESMYNKFEKSEIAKRIAIGKKYLNEAFPGELGSLFRPSFPQEPKYPDLPDEPNPDDYPSDEEGQRRYASAKKRYDSMVAKRERGAQRYEDELKDYNERLIPLYKKNIEVFRNVIVPIIDADWGDIKDDDVKKLKGFKEIHGDIKDNKKKFSGMKIFTDDNNVISLVYVTPMNSDRSRIVYFRDSDGTPIYDESTINDRIRERDSVFRQANDIFVKKLDFKWDDLPQLKTSSGETPNVEEVILNFLYWSFAKLNGTENGGKRFRTSEVLYNPNGLSDEDLLLSNMDSIFGDPKRKNDSAFVIRGIGTVNFNADRRQGPGNCINFVKYANKANAENSDFNPAEMLTDDVIKSILLGLVVRAEYDGKKIYTADEVISADRDQLLSMIYEVLDFDIYKSSLVYMSYKYKDSDFSKSSDLENPQSVLLLFPDVCRVEYIISTDIKSSILDNYEKRAQRQVYRSGMSDPIKDYEYDYRTGQRTRKDIAGTFKKTGTEQTTLDQFKYYSDYFKNTDFDDLNDIVKNSLGDRDAYKKYINALSSIKGYPDLVISFIKNNPEMENENEIMLLIEFYTAVEDAIETIMTNVDDDAEIGKAVDDILVNSESIIRKYNSISKNSDELKTKALAKAVRRSDRRTVQSATANDEPEDEYNSSGFDRIIKGISSDYPNVKRIIGMIDFSKADKKAIRFFRTKNDLVSMIDEGIGNALSFANSIVSKNDIESMKESEDMFRTVSEIIDSIDGIYSDNEESDAPITKALIELDDVLEDINELAEKRIGSSSQQAGMTA